MVGDNPIVGLSGGVPQVGTTPAKYFKPPVGDDSGNGPGSDTDAANTRRMAHRGSILAPLQVAAAAAAAAAAGQAASEEGSSEDEL